MMEYADFYDIAVYGNAVWKGSFTPKEVAENAYDYLCEFRCSKANGVITHTIKELVKLLIEDLKKMSETDADYETVTYWLETMAEELRFSADEWKTKLEE